MNYNAIAALNSIHKVKACFLKDVNVSKEKNTAAKTEARSEKKISQLFKGVRNCAETFFGKTIKEGPVGKFCRTINDGACRVFSGTFTRSSCSNTTAVVNEKQLSTDQKNAAILKEFRDAYFYKFEKPERMANHILSTFFNDGGGCAESRAAIDKFKEDLKNSDFSSKNIEYTQDGIKLTKGVVPSATAKPVTYISFDTRKIVEYPYLFDFMKTSSFDDVLELANKFIKDKKIMEQWLPAEREKYEVSVSKLDNLSSDMKRKDKVDLDAYLKAHFPVYTSQKPVLPVKSARVQEEGKKLLEKRAKMALPTNSAASSASTAATPAVDVIRSGIVAMNAPLVESVLISKSQVTRQPS